MTVLVIEDNNEEPEVAASEDVAEAVTDVAEAVADAIVDAVEEISENQPATDSPLTDIVVGVTLEQVANLEERVTVLEGQITATQNVAELALDIAVETPVEVVEETPPEQPPEDEPPATKRTKFNKWWFGERPGPG